jgi:TusA-related sulfurtransferase
MKSTCKLDLIHIISPLCLLKCKSELNRLNSGEVLEIWLQDYEVVENIEKIISLSNDRIIGADKANDRFCLYIEKQKPPTPLGALIMPQPGK